MFHFVVAGRFERVEIEERVRRVALIGSSAVKRMELDRAEIRDPQQGRNIAYGKEVDRLCLALREDGE